MNSERIKQIQLDTAYPESQSVKRALLQVWNECEQDKGFSKEDMRLAFEEGISSDSYSQFDTWIEQFKKTNT